MVDSADGLGALALRGEGTNIRAGGEAEAGVGGLAVAGGLRWCFLHLLRIDRQTVSVDRQMMSVRGERAEVGRCEWGCNLKRVNQLSANEAAGFFESLGDVHMEEILTGT